MPPYIMNSDSRIKNIEQAKLLIKAQQLEKLEKEKAEKLKAELAQQQKTEDLFLAAVKNARPLNTNRIHHEPSKPKPIPQQFIRDEKQALRDSLSDGYIPAYELESGEELLYLREGQSPSVLSKLRRGHWVIQANLDLHGLISDEARIQVGEFLAGCKKRGIRCVRIVHGKGLGSRNREPILKHKVRNWLIQKDEVIAYAQARATDGGSGAVIVLLKG
jgi:DNA-nicking Smr family endonuclease